MGGEGEGERTHRMVQFVRLVGNLGQIEDLEVPGSVSLAEEVPHVSDGVPPQLCDPRGREGHGYRTKGTTTHIRVCVYAFVTTPTHPSNTQAHKEQTHTHTHTHMNAPTMVSDT
mgnify:CR=1 FL=1